jgi:hypothetical protein
MFIIGAGGARARLALACCLMSLWLGNARSEDAPAWLVHRVEEDWELVVSEPHAETNGPQVTCVMSPVCDVEAAYAAFDINHHSQPNYSRGGLQLQVWHLGEPLLSNNDPDYQVLEREGETIRWTQQMTLDEGVLTFAIVNGQSQTWGTFGGNERLRISVATSLVSLNNYNPSISVEHSGIGYAANRVASLKLKGVRAYAAEELIYEDNTERVVYSHE